MTRYHLTAIGDYQHVLRLNPMMGNTEQVQEFGPFPDFAAALAYHDSEKVEPYTDEGPNPFNGGTRQYQKNFRKGSRLEWMNPLRPEERAGRPQYEQGIFEVLVNVTEVMKGQPLGY